MAPDTTPLSPTDASLALFHPVVAGWFAERVGEPTEPQRRAWPLIQRGAGVLVAAPTGSGKTFSAFLWCIDRLLRESIQGELSDQTQVLYISPLKALSNDVQKNLLAPLQEIEGRAREQGWEPTPLRVAVRTSDTPARERASMVSRPPHILITTPESLYLYLSSPKARHTLAHVRTVIVDEIHALARDKRGSHLALSLERLEALVAAASGGGALQRIGLSATQKPIQQVASFLSGAGRPPCEVVEVGHTRPWDLQVEIPDGPLTAVASAEMWAQVFDRLAELSGVHRTVLVFVNTRRWAERLAHELGERIGKEHVASHHGSLSREVRLDAEERLKSGRLKVMVATASLELGLDIGSIDLVCQIGSPRSISVLLQRVGRSGHHKGGISRGIVFAMTRDDLVESVALMAAVRAGELDALRMSRTPRDVLAQQLVAACGVEDVGEEAFYQMASRAWPWRGLSRQDFDQVVEMMAEGIAPARGRSRGLLHRDRVHGVLRARKGADKVALLNGGTIPDTFDFPVVAEPESRPIGTVNEDFAIESMPGDVFLLGSSTWQIQSVRQGVVRVTSAEGMAPTIPFWETQAPSRTIELSREVAHVRERVVEQPAGAEVLISELGLSAAVGAELHAYLLSASAMLGAIPTQRRIIAERFFDEAGGMQIVLHAPFGGRINRAWGLALRKRFCRSFDFELQAAANDDAILLSLGEQHSFPLTDIFDYLSPNTVEDVLVQAVLQTPQFGTRFRWNAARALAVERMGLKGRVPPILQRARSDDLLAAVFPDQVACQDNRGGGDIAVPDHPLVAETLEDCLREAMDIEGLKEVLRGLREGQIEARAVDLPTPSPLAHNVLNAMPWAFLDDAPLEERRARSVSLRRVLPPEDAAAFGALDAAAIAQVLADAQPLCRDPEELHEALLQLVIRPPAPAEELRLAALLQQERALIAELGGRPFALARERLPELLALWPQAPLRPALAPLAGSREPTPEEAAVEVVRGWMEIGGPTTVGELAEHIPLEESTIEQALLALEGRGQVLRGYFRPDSARDGASVEWCDRRLLRRIHRLTIGRLRAEIEPLTARDFMRFLFRWHHLEPEERLRGPGGLAEVVGLLEGYEAPASAWEEELIGRRLHDSDEDLLEDACWAGEVAWGRLSLREGGAGRTSGAARAPVVGRHAAVTFTRREDLDWLLQAARPGGESFPREELSHPSRDVLAALERRGALFFADLVRESRRLQAEVEDALRELVAVGLVTADGIDNLRTLHELGKKGGRPRRRGGPGRWSLLTPGVEEAEEVRGRLVRLLLRRYGIVWRDLLTREVLAPPWRELLPTLRRMEARGEVRGGRFVAGFAGEQFALPEAVERARAVRKSPLTGQAIRIAAVDPLNLTGVVLPGPRAPSLPGRMLTFVDGLLQPEAT